MSIYLEGGDSRQRTPEELPRKPHLKSVATVEMQRQIYRSYVVLLKTEEIIFEHKLGTGPERSGTTKKNLKNT
jgi:hypothetical protein